MFVFFVFINKLKIFSHQINRFNVTKLNRDILNKFKLLLNSI